MSAQKYAFDLASPTRFGKYSPLSISDIYTGTGELPMSYCEDYVRKAMSSFKPLGYDCEKFFSVSVKDGIVTVEINPKAYYYKGVRLKDFDFCREFNNVLRELESGWPFDIYDGHELITDCCFSSSDDEERNAEWEKKILIDNGDDTVHTLRHGKPKYISWLINNVGFFSLNPSDLEALEQLRVLEFYGLYLKELEQGKYSINQSFLKLKKKFSEHTKVLNEKKWKAFIEKQEQASEAESYESWGDSWSSSRNRDFYSDDDEDQIMRGLANGDGDLFGF